MVNTTAQPARTVRLACVLAAFAVGGALALAQQNPAQSADIKSLHVQGNVWMLVGGPYNAAVQIGNDGVLVVDTMIEGLADKMVAEIRRLAGDKPIRYIINTHVHPDHTGGNEKVTSAGQSIIAGNFAGQVGQDAANTAIVIAHENVLNRMSAPVGAQAPRPFKALGYPVAPAAFAVASFVIVANAIYSDPRPSGAGVLIIVAGIPLYLIFARRRASGSRSQTGNSSGAEPASA